MLFFRVIGNKNLVSSKSNNYFRIRIISAVILSLFSIMVFHKANADTNVSFALLSDLHGALQPHAGVIHEPDGSERYVTQGGGMAKLATVLNQMRTLNNQLVTVGVGDYVHGGAEVLFTVGDAIMPALNALGLDAYTPGNWEFGYGPAVFRNRFASFGPKPPLPANIQVMADAYGGSGVTAATFTTLAINLYNDATSAPLPQALHNTRVLAPYKIVVANGLNIGIIGITSSIIAQSNPAFNIGLRFTQGHSELPEIISAAKSQGAEMIVVLSELGLTQNLQLGREFDDVHIIFSGHTHEMTVAPFIADKGMVTAMTPGGMLSNDDKARLENGATVIVEAAEDTQIGQLDISWNNGKVKDLLWVLQAVDDAVAEDATMKALVDAAEEPFIAGSDGLVARHTFMPGGYCPAGVGCGDITKRGHQLTEDLDTVVGFTDVILHRRNALERPLDNFISDAFRSVSDGPIAAQTNWSGVDLASTNGFRFGVPVLSSNEVAANAAFYDGRATGEVTLRDLYSIYPLGAGIVVASFPASSLQLSFEIMLENVFSRHPFRQRGGWYLGFSDTVYQTVDLLNRPYAEADGRIVQTFINGSLLDPSKQYVQAGFYGHSYPLGQVSRSKGGIDPKYLALSDVDDYNSAIVVYGPKNSEKIIQQNIVKQVAPDKYLHPVQVFRRYIDSLPGKLISSTQFSIGRVVNVNANDVSLPAVPLPSSAPLPHIVQPINGLGPDFYSRF